jgi:hypothetical protein
MFHAKLSVSLFVQIVQAVQPLRSVQTLSFILPRDAGEEQRWELERFERFKRLERVQAHRAGSGP